MNEIHTIVSDLHMKGDFAGNLDPKSVILFETVLTTMKAKGSSTLINLGDIFDRTSADSDAKYIKLFETVSALLVKHDVIMYYVMGNHDTYSRIERPNTVVELLKYRESIISDLPNIKFDVSELSNGRTIVSKFSLVPAHNNKKGRSNSDEFKTGLKIAVANFRPRWNNVLLSHCQPVVECHESDQNTPVRENTILQEVKNERILNNVSIIFTGHVHDSNKFNNWRKSTAMHNVSSDYKLGKFRLQFVTKSFNEISTQVIKYEL